MLQATQMKIRFPALLAVPLMAMFGQRPPATPHPPPSVRQIPVRAQAVSPRWKLIFQHDVDNETLQLVDLKFPSARRGVAVGNLLPDKKGPKHVALVTNDSGASWDWVRLKDAPVSLFFLDDSTGWLVTANGLWQTLESGHSWTKVKAPSKDIIRVYFRDREHGWAFGGKKSLFVTVDGGKKWERVNEAAEISTKADYSAFLWMEFASPKVGMLVGVARPPRRGASRFPAWLEPESAARREWPATSLFLETRDAGATWKATLASIFGTITRIRFLPNGQGLALFEFQDEFDYPSELMRLDLMTGKSEPVFRRRDRAITDIALLPDGTAFAVGFEPPGRLHGLPIPGKLKVLKSEMPDRKLWVEMPVDYRADARRAVIATAGPGQVWVATDTGMILKLFGAN